MRETDKKFKNFYSVSQKDHQYILKDKSGGVLLMISVNAEDSGNGSPLKLFPNKS